MSDVSKLHASIKRIELEVLAIQRSIEATRALACSERALLEAERIPDGHSIS